MDIISPFLSSGLWSLTVSLSLIIVLVSCTIFWYSKNRIKSIVGEGKTCADIAAQVDILQADKKSLEEWLLFHKEELLKLKADREEQEIVRRELDMKNEEIGRRQDNLVDLQKDYNKLASEKEILSSVIASLREEQAKYELMKEDFSRLHTELARVKSGVQSENAKLVRYAEAKIQHGLLVTNITLLEGQIQEKMQQREDLMADTQRLNLGIRQLQDNILQLQNNIRQLQEKKNSLQALEQKVEDTNKKIHDLHDEHSALESEINKVKETKIQLAKNLAQTKLDLSSELSNSHKIKQQVTDLKHEEQGLIKDVLGKKSEVDQLRANKAALEQEIKRLEGFSGKNPEVLDAYADLYTLPQCLKGLERPRDSKISEIEMLERLRERLRQDKHYFSQRIIDAFHTSLKCQSVNPLTVLAGISGTGKTLLPNKYADFMGIHKLVMAVQPRWDSPQDLFGFYNYLEKQYKAKDLSRLLVHMDPYNAHEVKDRLKDMGNRLVLVLLDEMNLARTEYYFSEFLSRLELRQLVTIKGDRSTAELELDTGSSKSLRVWVPENVFFVGTMNEDESTQTLSDKVLDRSNVLRFGKPAAQEDRRTSSKRISEVDTHSYLQFTTWKSWLKEPNAHTKEHDQVMQWINRLNETMDKIGRSFGFRMEKAMLTYVANYPEKDKAERYKLAFADQIEQKLLPKLRGIDMDGVGNEVIHQVGEVIEDLNDKELSNAYTKACAETSTGMFQWRGVTRELNSEL